MKRFIVIIAALAIFAAPAAFAEKVYVTKNIDISEYTSVDCNIPCDIEYVHGPAAFKVSATQDALDHLVASVSGGKLKICFDKTKIFNTGGIRIWISSSSISSISLNGAVEFKAERGIVANTFDATLNGASKLEIDGLQATKAVITANGTASMDVEKAECDNIEMKINGAGDFDLENVVCKQLKASVNGAGDCDLEGIKCDNLTVTVNGAGGSKIEGYAKEASLTVNGVGGIDAKNFTADVMNTAMNGIGKISR